ncbi:MAG TPA: hypothetical protein VG405_06570 [Solirubrobacteraceae bacterium]|jgi:hypothetical protein|nr:hypothetical protein [Solirubrobacteraceae bacterium]
MINWLLSLPTVLIVVVVLAATYAMAGVIYLVVMGLSASGRANTFTSLSPGLLSPLGVVFGLIVAFLASGIWSNASIAQTAVNTEASSMRAAVLLSDVFSESTRREMRILVSHQVEEDVKVDWPAMRNGTASLQSVPGPLRSALLLAFHLHPHGSGEIEAQRQLVSQIQSALDARRERIIVSHSQINAVKWFGVIALGFLLLAYIACMHAAQRGTAMIALAIFATAVGLSLILILSQDRPFTGPFGIKPAPLQDIRMTA